MQSESIRVEHLEQENQKLRGDRKILEQALGDVSRRLDTYEAQAVRLAEELDVDDLPSAEPAAGGGTPDDARSGRRYWFGDEVDALRSRTHTLGESFEELDGALREHLHILAATPTRMPVDGWLSHGYGWRKDPFTGDREFHQGMDIVAPAGTDVVAPADGVVIRAGRYGAYGKSVDLSHGLGYSTRYGHLSEILVRPGMRLERGQRIGRVGSTGRSTGPHLHYEIFRDGRRINPWEFVRQHGS